MTNITGTCPVCDAQVTTASDTQESEIISCPDCSSRLVVTQAKNNHIKLEPAPDIEEDWGQ